MSEPRTLGELVAALAQAPASRGVTFVDERFEERRAAWRDLAAEAAGVARTLRASGVEPGHRVLVPMASTPASVAALLGTFLADAIPLTVPGAARLGQDPEWAGRRAEAVVERHGLRHALQPSGDATRVRSIRASAPEPLARARHAGPEDVALIQFSSGTTRRPKGVELSHRAVLTNIALAGRVDARDPGAVHVTWLPLHHDMGLVGGLLASLPAAHDLVLMDPACFVLRPVSWLDALTRHRATSTAAPNFALAVTCERVPDAQLRRRHVDLSSVRALYDGAEPVRPLTVRRFEERFREHGLAQGVVRPVYGLAEATLIVTSPQGRRLAVRDVGGLEVPSVGAPLGDFEVRIVVPGTERDAAAGASGEILLRGASLFSGYHQDAAATREAMASGWLRTGDLGVMAEGELYVTGRLKDLLIVAGRNVHAHEIGDVVDDLPFARRGHSHAVAVPRRRGAPDDGPDEIVVLLSPAAPAARRLRRAADELAAAAEALGPAGGALGRWARALAAGAASLLTPSRDERRLAKLARELEPQVRRHVQRTLGLAIDRVELVRRLPKTTSGKVRREACVELAMGRRVRAPSAQDPSI